MPAAFPVSGGDPANNTPCSLPGTTRPELFPSGRRCAESGREKVSGSLPIARMSLVTCRISFPGRAAITSSKAFFASWGEPVFTTHIAFRNSTFAFNLLSGYAFRILSHRNWQFDEEVLAGRSRKEETTYKIEKEKEQWVVLFLPQEFTTVQETRFKARLKFIHAAEMAEGKSYEMKKEELGYKKEVLVVRRFGQYSEASEYLYKIATDKFLLKYSGKRKLPDVRYIAGQLLYPEAIE